MRLTKKKSQANWVPVEVRMIWGSSVDMPMSRRNTVAGEAWGSFRDANGAVVTLAGPTPASLAAVSGVLNGWGAGGALDGAFNVGAAGCSNNGHTWLLRPR